MARVTAAEAKERQSEREYLQECLRRASVSRESRRAYAMGLRTWYEEGTETGEGARFNKLRSHVDKLASYIWSPESVRFSIHLPPAAREDWMGAAGTARDEFRQTWSISGADLAISLALEWSLVYAAMPLKVQQDPNLGFVVYAIDPWDFGVTREDQSTLADQDVLCHWYTLSMPQFERWCQGHPREEELIGLAARHTATPPSAGSGTRLIISGMSGAFPGTTVGGSMPGGAESMTPMEAQVSEPVVHLTDIWERRTYRDPLLGEFPDWRVTTVLTDPVEPLVRRRNPILPWLRSAAGPVMPSDHPFTLLVPRPTTNYLWGRSELAGLIRLQSWREEHMRRMDEVIQRQLDPSKFFSGVPDYEEAGRAMSVVGGSYGVSEPGAKMESLRPDLGQEPFMLLGQIDSMFADQGGMPPVLQGEMPPGVRAENQLVSLAGIGAGRIRHMALQLEAALSRVATLGFHILQRGDDQTYSSPDGTRFLLAQLPPGLSMRVSAHSASPIFAEQTHAKALELLRGGAIDGEWLVELLDPPNREEIKETARKLAQSRAQHNERLIELEVERLRRRRGRPG